MLKKLLLAALAVSLVQAGTAGAADDHVRRFTVGTFEVVALADVPMRRGAELRPDLLVGLDTMAREKVLSGNAMDNSINAFVVRLGDEVLLFDTGLGKAKGGKLMESMLVAGIRPEDVTAVIITHFHADHIGGLVTAENTAVFKNARLMVPRVEMEAMARAAAPFREAYAGRLQMFEWDSYVANGVQALEAAGHTPGHTVFLIDDGTEKFLIISDLIHFEAIQLPLPDVAVTYDSDPTKAIAARKRWFDTASKQGMTVAGMHLSFPGIGKLTKQGQGYGFTRRAE